MNAPVKNRPSAVTSFGCRLNALEGERVRALLDETGAGDTIVVNTCAVTGEAVRQARQALRRARRDNPGATVVATGCAAQIDPDSFAAMSEVDRVVGNTEKLDLAYWAGLSQQPPVAVRDIMSVRETAPQMVDAFGARTRAFLEVQNGCDHRCTFCIIPYGRGPSRSVPMGRVVAEAKRLVDAGHAELVLTGVDITSYGSDLPGQPKLGDLVMRLLTMVPGLARLRLSSIDSIETDEALLEVFASEHRLMPHLHLSLQAGDDMVLKRMKRRHLRADAVEFCDAVRRRRPDVTFGADLIAGFPTETDGMFENTRALIADCGLTHVHVFPFSPREGTPAARMPPVPRQVVKERAASLRATAEEAQRDGLAGMVGQHAEVLVEEDNRGRTATFWRARVDGPSVSSGQIVFGRVRAVEDSHLSVTPDASL